MITSKNRFIQDCRKLVIVGDSMCGKTSLLLAFKDNQFIQTCNATISKTYATDIQVDGQTIDLTLLDTAGLEDYSLCRQLSYPNAHVVIICFNVISPISARNVIDIWTPEIRHFCGQCPIVLVACKKDLRTDSQIIAKLKQEGEKPVTNETGKRLATEIKADVYMECSAKTREGVQDLFIQAVRLSLKNHSHKKSHRTCVLY
ncbi:unnamed protein product [Rotaria sp. Silwood2]|nr:unnamed protein product [Rotaria sp. Silwood2]CAF3051978.1 unnamed protein product [Rotaria sp. Silwood2]CAF3212474.1 unnamed protein product [Rotaria sp. Silwood2]CAF4139593.1 unnamed protein product [Rotaria sp. Silwood2]CAF4245258.1 unnamed protein product [Rotaria sp. Silwood2]